MQAGCDAIEAACPDGLPDSELDAESNLAQREKLCVRLERLAASLTSSTDEPSANDLAERLKLALAANTIGGAAATQREQALRDAADTAERLREKWQRLGLVIGHRARALARRFEKAGAELTPSVAGARGAEDAPALVTGRAGGAAGRRYRGRSDRAHRADGSDAGHHPAGATAYLCGPVPFMKTVRAQLLASGVPASRLHYEVFWPGSRALSARYLWPGQMRTPGRSVE